MAVFLLVLLVVGLLFAHALQLGVGGPCSVLFAVGVIIGVLLVLALNVEFNPVLLPVGVPVNFGGCFGCCFVNGGNQAHGGFRWFVVGCCPGGFPGLAGGLNAAVDLCKLSQVVVAGGVCLCAKLAILITHHYHPCTGFAQILSTGRSIDQNPLACFWWVVLQLLQGDVFCRLELRI